MTEQAWISVAHGILAALALAFAVWMLIKAQALVDAARFFRALLLALIAVGIVFIAILAALLALL